ncbi:MAG TPA: cellulase family glycosylhydrolase [Planctomycetota bacterium]|nr:cellulase family glycosylhydrolase [Planctomycetota bacterium]
MSVVILRESGFPTLDAAPVADGALEALARAHRGRFVTVADLPAALAQRPRLLVLPYGSAFPSAAWSAFIAYLGAGGSWLNLGGSPLARPVWREGQAWRVGVENRAYPQRIGIQQAYPEAIDAAEAAAGFAAVGVADVGRGTAWALQPRLAEVNELPEECGTQGQRDARIAPLIVGRRGGRAVASPALVIDRDRGEFAGGRWVLAPTSAALPDALVAALAAEALRRRVVVTIDTGFATFAADEPPRVRVRIACAGDEAIVGTLRVQHEGATVHQEPIRIAPRDGAGESASGAIAARAPGFYRIAVEIAGAPSATVATHGFWVRDAALLTGGGRITVGRDYLERDGRPFPVAGTTYMSTVSHRRFLVEPTPAAWHDDFAAMRAAGINLVRTGLWYLWKAHVHEDGAAREDVLRALEAFLLSARAHGIAIIFNVYAFVPPNWGGGVNPWLDPAAVAAQAAFVASLVRRFKDVPDLMWDFINEPSVTSPQRLWVTRPNYDRVEAAAWSRWLEQATPDEWRERFRMAADEPLGQPTLDDFSDANWFTGKRPLRAGGFHWFAQEAFIGWLAAMARAVRVAGGSRQLIMVGQDEGGSDDRPNPQLYAHLVDMTCNHPWWRNDDLLWSAVTTKTLHKPNLMQEVGVMFYEALDRTAWRTPERARNLLERKLALSFAGGCGGFVQWLWNTNHYNVSDNEAGIGLLRSDGSQKPEFAALSRLAVFVAKHADRFRGRALERACVVLPLGGQYSVRNQAVPATRRALRTLEYRLGIACRAVPESRAAEAEGATLIVLPSPRVVSQACWDALLSLVERGATLAVSGFLDADEWHRPAPRLATLGIDTSAVTVHRDEAATLVRDGRTHVLRATYDGELVQRLHKAGAADGGALDARIVEHGKGRVIWCPLPIELAQAEEQCLAYYRVVAAVAGLEARDAPPGVLLRAVELADATLWIAVNESSTAARLAEVGGLGAWARDIVVPADRSLLAFSGTDGELIDRSEPPP